MYRAVSCQPNFTAALVCILHSKIMFLVRAKITYRVINFDLSSLKARR